MQPEQREESLLEFNRNALSRFYLEVPTESEQYYRKVDTDVQKELRMYTHKDAIQFAAESLNWRWNDRRPLRRDASKVETSTCQKGIRAYYRVLGKNQSQYVLIACHINVHAFHRKDLRFVEVNDRTIVQGLENSSVIGKLYPGDVVAVTKLSLKSRRGVPWSLNSPSVLHRDLECKWEVENMTILTRKKVYKVNFMLLENGTAIVEGFAEAMNVSEETIREPLEQNKIYIGNAFVPEKIRINFTEDFHRRNESQLIALTSNLHSYPNSLGTIYTYQYSAHQTRLFEIGINAFNREDREIFHTRSNEADEVVETCVRMGAAAARTVSSGRYDGRSFPMKNIRREDLILHFSIPNPKVQPTEGRWNTNNRIFLDGNGVKTEAIIESVVLSSNESSLLIAARLPKDTVLTTDFRQNTWIVNQCPSSEILKLERGFFKRLHRQSNGRRVIETLYGGPPIINRDINDDDIFFFPCENPILLNKYQSSYVSMILASEPLVLGNSPFGCGKSMTIVTAAIEVHKKNCRYNKHGKQRKQLLISQTNHASVSLIEIAAKVTGENIKFLRYVNESNWKVLADSSRSRLDMPTLQKEIFVAWATGSSEEMRNFSALRHGLKTTIVRKVTRDYLSPLLLAGEAKRIYENMSEELRDSEPSQRALREAFFYIYQPDVIVITADSLPTLLASDVLGYVGNVQIDEASQLPEHTLIYLLKEFSNAGFGLVGDIKQLPPHCETELTGLLKDYGIGNTMERASRDALFPQAVLRYVYRCHPVTTQLLSELFYNGRLMSEIEENERNEFMRKRPDIWPNRKYPILVLNHEGLGYRIGTSVANHTEMQHVFEIVRILTQEVNGYRLKHSDIGVISFYRAQSSFLTEAFRGTGVKCGTIDAFQGTEREVMIVCCTNEKPSDFMKLGNRVNVAMSRARQATLIIGNVDKLRVATYWSTIIRHAETNNSVINEISSFSRLSMGSFQSARSDLSLDYFSDAEL
uniref:AAA_12 domain-containing protein n=1 Tax=Caenorhabditis tropicalis TaxID=1561998 RepID=A0A1I7TYC9_9PELO